MYKYDLLWCKGVRPNLVMDIECVHAWWSFCAEITCMAARAQNTPFTPHRHYSGLLSVYMWGSKTTFHRQRHLFWSVHIRWLLPSICESKPQINDFLAQHPSKSFLSAYTQTTHIWSFLMISILQQNCSTFNAASCSNTQVLNPDAGVVTCAAATCTAAECCVSKVSNPLNVYTPQYGHAVSLYWFLTN